jgi:RNA polymerase sigma-70 factor (ECF subfamily)
MMIGAAMVTAHPSSEASTFAMATVELTPYVRAVVAAVLRENREHPDVDDCTSEALRRALEGQARLKPGEPLRPWLAGIARHVALDMIRARKRAFQRTALTRDDESGPLEKVADARPGPFESVATAEDARDVQRALDALAEGPRTALRLFHVEGLDYAAIGKRLNVPLGTVATWINRARKSIAASLEER